MKNESVNKKQNLLGSNITNNKFILAILHTVLQIQLINEFAGFMLFLSDGKTLPEQIQQLSTFIIG